GAEVPVHGRPADRGGGPGPARGRRAAAGATRGFTSFAGFSPQAGIALVSLTNTAPTLRSRFVQRSYEALRALA
ncbi:hypothetical protein AB0G02_31110, partial [Actinosynnema sp. NPDC023658]|uniref:hypothetical protein n=1 Tax=Actinosynnema sp. NPDC023658 TaxID=3155465 RepID=UPI003404BA9B